MTQRAGDGRAALSASPRARDAPGMHGGPAALPLADVRGAYGSLITP